MTENNDRNLMIRDALKEAMSEEMRLDPNVLLMGEEVGGYNGAYKCSKGMLDEFGDKRVIDTPIAETGFAGIGIGAAMMGLRPIVEFMTFNFSLIAIDQILNTAAKAKYMSAGEINCPIVFRGANGPMHQLGAQHCNAFESFYANTPGLTVIAPSTPYDMKGLLKSSIRSDNPVIFMEAEKTYSTRGYVPEEEYLIPIGVADVKKEGSDVTLISWSKSVFIALELAEKLAESGVSAEVVDLRTLRPLDTQTIFNSVAKTNRAVIIQDSTSVASYGSYVAQLISTEIFDELDAPVQVVSSLEVPMPYSKSLEAVVWPNIDRCMEAVSKIL